MFVFRRRPLLATTGDGEDAPIVEQPIDLAAFESLNTLDSTIETYSNFYLNVPEIFYLKVITST
jgi:hypothetical protein